MLLYCSVLNGSGGGGRMKCNLVIVFVCTKAWPVISKLASGIYCILIDYTDL
jgi:hypothetical protein